MRTWILATAITAVLTWPAAADELVTKLTAEQLQTAVMPDGVQLEVTFVDGEPVATVSNTNPNAVSVQFAEITLGPMKGPRLSYDASISSENLARPAYLELWVVVQGEAYFSRALNDAFSGRQTRRRSTTPFFLQGEESPETARLGLRFEGPGTVTVSEIELWQRDTGALGGTWGGILGSIVGITAGIWGSVASYYVSRGRARGAVLGTTAAFAIAGYVVLLIGGIAWLRGGEWDLWFTCVLLGLIVAIVESSAYCALRARYRQSEERRMMAMDMH